ncbi:MAG: amidohydrolase [Deltaproteobacteria bacterium]|nr:amidohydrolase [Deltaproteobacteria bacterium]MBW2019624.1 amidohydrolase [Deltaproteobacteria bacterium]MBW2074439.1 amidohydrolase [Deltaproteobacteria bacterium]RLB82391.1 MAG: S-adenosylhomocysteine deaminase [Deltaproteobacteria bacterium]
MDPQGTLIERGAVAVSGDRIVQVGPQDAVSASYQAEKNIDARGGIIMPGLVNTHTHAAMTLFRGLADDLPLMTWLHDYIFPAEAKLTFDLVYQGTRLACSEMILSGTTTFCDMYLFEGAVAQAAKEAGMRAVVGEVIYDFPSPNYGPVEEGLKYTEDLIEKWRGDPLITIAVEPHSPYLCSPELLQKARAIADRNGVPMVIHLSESEREVAQIMEKYGRTPVAHLADIGFLNPNLIADHCVVLTKEDMGLLKRFDVKVAHNPESNMKLASGIAPIPALLEHGVTVGIGTDGCASNNNLDLFQEMDTAAKLHKVHTLDPTVLDARTVVRMATIDGARVLGMSDIIGSLEAGKKADIIIIDINRPHLTPLYNIYSHLVYAVTGNDVVTAIVNGRVLMEDRALTTLDVDEVMATVNRIAQGIKAMTA